MKIKLNRLVEIGVQVRVVNDAEADVLRALKNYRNVVTHSDIDNLAVGTILWRQNANLTIGGVEASSDWEKIIPESQDHKEIASDLIAERKVGDLLVKVREVVHDIFDRHSARARILDSQI